jgi:hypothetical protein
MPPRPSASKPRRETRTKPIYVTRGELRALLDVIERNTARIDRLEDVFALHASERAAVKADLEAIKAILLAKKR